MNILLIGSGGREHALAWKITQSPLLDQLYTLPGNPGTAQVGINLPGDPLQLEKVAGLVEQYQIDLTVIGPEVPLAAGLGDRLRAGGIPVFGPSQSGARIESSKAFAKAFMERHGLPTADFQTFTAYEEAWWSIQEYARDYPQLPVIKASGLAGGKGVFLPETLSDADEILRQLMIEKSLGKAGREVVIEERLEGQEVSVLAFADGKTVLPMLPVQDHKRLLDHDRGPNTGGMGVFAPSLNPQSALMDQIREDILQPAVEGLAEEGIPFIGVLYGGLILTEEGPKVLEFNCRFGDPETQVLMPLLASDLVPLMGACVEGNLDRFQDALRWLEGAAICVILASGGYPENYQVGFPIQGLDELPPEVIVFQAGTRIEKDRVVTNGGRVLGVTARGSDLAQARALAYESISDVHFEGMLFRNDIGIDGTTSDS